MGNVTFNETKYIDDLEKAVRGALNIATRNIYKAMSVNLASLKVRKVDAEHQRHFASALHITNKSTAHRFAKSITMLNNAPNDTFRALYYEYGTGANMRPPTGWTPSSNANDWNPVRPKQVGAPIYYRGGKWTDLGGNVHKGGVKPGVKKLIPQKNIYGHPVRAQFWFQNGLRTGIKNLDRLVLQAVKSVPITSYIKIRDVRARM